MPDAWRRWLTRLGEDRSKAHGSIDRLCGCKAMLSPHPSWPGWFLAACREYLAEVLLDPRQEVARAQCASAEWLPRQLRHLSDLKRVPQQAWLPAPATLRQQRRQGKVLENMLSDLGWSRARSRYSRELPIQWSHGVPWAKCSSGQWHPPRVAALLGDRWISPVFDCSSTVIGSDLPTFDCNCGRNLGRLS